MKLKHICITTALVFLSWGTKHSIVEGEEQLYEALSTEEDLSDVVPLFPVADILAEGNKFRMGVFKEDLFREDAEYLTDTVSFKKIINTERTEENPFPRTIEPLEMDLRQENLRKSEWESFKKLRDEVKKYWDKYYAGELSDDEITKQELHDLNKWVYILINPNNEGFEHNDSVIHNPQLIIVINEPERKITKMPVSLGKYGVLKNRFVEGSTPSGIFSIQTHFPVNASLTPWVETPEVTYLDAVHSRINSPGNGAYKINKDYYERWGATMVKWLISIWPWLEYISTPSAEGNISRKRWIFIHGSNSLKSRTFGKNASNGCLRMHPEHRDVLQKKLVFGKPYKREDWKRVWLDDLDNNDSTWNNKIIFEKTQSHDQEYFFTAWSPRCIMEESKKTS